MSIQTFSSIPSLVDAVKTKIDSFDIVSFDMFDTLLVRRVSDPDLVKNATTRFIDNKAKQKGLWSSFRLVDALRTKIEDEHRARNGKEYPDHEANYDQFMPEMLKQHFGEHYTDDLFASVVDYEMQMESEILVARQAFVEFIDYLQVKGKRLFLLSDMYLPSYLLKRLLADKDMDNYFEAIVSSADSFQAKASGTAYPLLEKNHSLDRSCWIHIGDHPWSDGEKPSEFGIDAFVLTDEQEIKRKKIAERYKFLSQKQPLWAGRNLQQIMLPMEAENVERSELYADGYQFFAYLFGTMLFKLKNRADELKIKKLYFCAREGWLLKKCWELMAPTLWPEEVDNYELHYLYVSRLSLGKASRANVGLTIADIENALRPVNNKDFTDVARIYGLNIKPLTPYLEKYGLTSESDISAISRTQDKYVRLVQLCDDIEFVNAVKEQAKVSNAALCAYLAEEGFLRSDDANEDKDNSKTIQERVALIDIGWVGTIQSSLNQAVSHRVEDRPIIHGFFMSSNAMANIYPPSHHSQIEGLLYDDARFSSVSSILNSCKDIFEEVTRASHPTLLEYQEGQEEGKGYHLHFRSQEHESFAKEMEQFNAYGDLHSGIFDGVQKFASALAVHNYDANVLQDWCDVLIVGKLGLPNSSELQRLTNQYHQDDFSRQGEQRKVNKNIQKQLNREQTIWSVSSGFKKSNLLYKVYLLNRFIRNIRRR